MKTENIYIESYEAKERVPSRASWPPLWMPAEGNYDAESVQNMQQFDDLGAAAGTVWPPVEARIDTRAGESIVATLPDVHDRESEDDVVEPLALDTTACDRCRSREFIESHIHNGQSVRRDCARCRRFIAFPIWYGVEA